MHLVLRICDWERDVILPPLTNESPINSHPLAGCGGTTYTEEGLWFWEGVRSWVGCGFLGLGGKEDVVVDCTYGYMYG